MTSQKQKNLHKIVKASKVLSTCQTLEFSLGVLAVHQWNLLPKTNDRLSNLLETLHNIRLANPLPNIWKATKKEMDSTDSSLSKKSRSIIPFQWRTKLFTRKVKKIWQISHKNLQPKKRNSKTSWPLKPNKGIKTLTILEISILQNFTPRRAITWSKLQEKRIWKTFQWIYENILLIFILWVNKNFFFNKWNHLYFSSGRCVIISAKLASCFYSHY